MKYGTIAAGTQPWLRARVVDDAEAPLMAADVSAISYSLYTVAADGTRAAVAGQQNQSVSVASVWHDTLQSWAVDSIGYNFLDTRNVFVDAGTLYELVYTLTTSAGTLTLTFQVRTLGQVSPRTPYCLRKDVEDVFGVTNVAKWADMDGDGDDAKIEARINAALAYAAGEIDDRLRGRPYAVPIVSPCPSIVWLAATMAGVWLYESRGVQDFDETTGRPSHKLAWARERAERILGDIAAGRRRPDIPVNGAGVRSPIVG